MVTFNYDDNIEITVEKATDLIAADLNGFSDPYVNMYVNYQRVVKKTETKFKTLNPEWNETHTFYGIITGNAETVKFRFEVFDFDRFSKDDFIGRATLELKADTIVANKVQNLVLDLCDVKSGKLYISYKYNKGGKSPFKPYVPTPPVELRYGVSVADKRFGVSFNPSIPEDFILTTSNDAGTSKNATYIGVRCNEIIRITYRDIGSADFDETADLFMTAYLRDLALENNDNIGKFELKFKLKDVTPTHQSTRLAKVLETQCTAAIYSKNVNILMYTCKDWKVLLNFALITSNDLDDLRYDLLWQVASSTAAYPVNK